MSIKAFVALSFMLSLFCLMTSSCDLVSSDPYPNYTLEPDYQRDYDALSPDTTDTGQVP